MLLFSNQGEFSEGVVWRFYLKIVLLKISFFHRKSIALGLREVLSKEGLHLVHEIKFLRIAK